MSCCAPGTESALEMAGGCPLPPDAEILAASRDLGNGICQTDLAVPAVHCGACIATIEQALAGMEGVESARVNLSTQRVAIRWRQDQPLPGFVGRLASLGYPAHLFDITEEAGDRELSGLLQALAVAGFAAANIMLLSVSVWSGAESATRDLFHWVSAFIAVPALAFSGRVFFVSAWNALRHGRTNMDVPISIGVSLAYAMSLYETVNHGEHAYFDAAVTLLFFLLIGRTLDHMMRERARSAVRGLAKLAARGAMAEDENGVRAWLPVADIKPGMRILIAAGERVPVDGLVADGRSEIDCSLVTGESAPQAASPGSALRAGTMNLTGPLAMTATAVAENSFLAEMVRLMEAAEGGRARYRRIADRAAALYAPAVHLTAFLSFLGWLAVSGDWHRALTIAIAVLIITCPCALGLAVPIVQVVAARKLFESGVMVRDGAAMERLAEADSVLFDKTGTLTFGQPVLSNAGQIAPDMLALAASLATGSTHPLSRALALHAQVPQMRFDAVTEVPGCGIEAKQGDVTWRLGRREWAVIGNDPESVGTEAVLGRNGEIAALFTFADRLRPEAAEAVSRLKQAGLGLEILSGDRRGAVSHVAASLAIPDWRAALLPQEKLARIKALADGGRKALMVGDGLNDAPALQAAHVSMAPATAADIGRNAADFIFLRDSLSAVPKAISVARRSARLIRENFAIAIAYNIIAVPLAILGYVTPLIAALAMSGSSVLVVANAMRLMRDREPAARPAPDASHRLHMEPGE